MKPRRLARAHTPASTRAWITLLALSFVFVGLDLTVAPWQAEAEAQELDLLQLDDTDELQRRRRRRRRRRSRLPFREGPYLRLAFGTPGGCYSGTNLCPDTASSELNPLSIDGSLGVRFDYIAVEFRGFYNPYEINNQLGIGQSDEDLIQPFFGTLMGAVKIFPLSGLNRGRVRWDPYLNLGVGYMHVSGQQDGQKYTSDGAAIVTGVGVDYFVAQPFAIGLGYDALFFTPEDPIQDETTFWAARLNFTIYFGPFSSSKRKKKKKKARPATRPRPPKKKKKKTY